MILLRKHFPKTSYKAHRPLIAASLVAVRSTPHICNHTGCTIHAAAVALLRYAASRDVEDDDMWDITTIAQKLYHSTRVMQ